MIASLTEAAVGGTPVDAQTGGAVGQNAVENNSLIVDKNGVVIRNIPNDDYNIYQYDYACSPIAGNNCPNLTDFDKLYNSPKKVVGQVRWQDSFTSPESGLSANGHGHSITTATVTIKQFPDYRKSMTIMVKVTILISASTVCCIVMPNAKPISV